MTQQMHRERLVGQEPWSTGHWFKVHTWEDGDGEYFLSNLHKPDQLNQSSSSMTHSSRGSWSIVILADVSTKLQKCKHWKAWRAQMSQMAERSMVYNKVPGSIPGCGRSDFHLRPNREARGNWKQSWQAKHGDKNLRSVLQHWTPNRTRHHEWPKTTTKDESWPGVGTRWKANKNILTISEVMIFPRQLRRQTQSRMTTIWKFLRYLAKVDSVLTFVGIYF